MARPESRYVCGTCGASSLRWEGQCRACGEWNTMAEVALATTRASSRRSAAVRNAAVPLTTLGDAEGNETERLALGVQEMDRVLGGGLVAGSVVLVGGEPGIGKSTLALALAGALARQLPGARLLYVSGEESAAQVRLRARRMGMVDGGPAGAIDVLPETNVEAIAASAAASQPALLIVDSIQTMTADDLEGPAGSVGQVRTAAARLQSFAKETGTPVILVGHVTKDGTLAGPKTLEHLVDVVLTLEGERFSGLRLLRASKNRFGSTQEVGVFEMTDTGLAEVTDPARAFIESGTLGAPGVAVAATLEGSRPLLVEVQALVTPALHGSPRRAAAGLDTQRLNLLIAVLGRRAGINLASHDVYASVAGGLTVDEPAIDLPLAVALASALRDRPVEQGTVLAGEVGLTGELRPVSGLERRIREAARLGFSRAVIPRAAARDSGARDDGRMADVELVRAQTLRAGLDAALASGEAGQERKVVPVASRSA